MMGNPWLGSTIEEWRRMNKTSFFAEKRLLRNGIEVWWSAFSYFLPFRCHDDCRAISQKECIKPNIKILSTIPPSETSKMGMFFPKKRTAPPPKTKRHTLMTSIPTNFLSNQHPRWAVDFEGSSKFSTTRLSGQLHASHRIMAGYGAEIWFSPKNETKLFSPTTH